MDDKKVQFIPFNAINEFMLPDFRQHVIQMVFAQQEKLPGSLRSALTNQVKNNIKVPGFRNSTQAPAALKARAAVSTFERRADFVAQVLQGWSELHPDLRQRVYDFLKAREWELLPPDADRTKLPGFLIVWPEGQNYDVLGEAYTAMYPGEQPADNDLRLMIVWLANRLPYDMYAEDEEVEEEE